MAIAIHRTSIGLALIVLIAAGFPTWAGSVSSLVPEEPVAGGSITVTYDPDAPGARLGGASDLYLVLSYQCTDHGRRRVVVRMNGSCGGPFRQSQALPPDVAVVTARFTTLREGDAAASINAMVRRPDGEPVRTAWEQSMVSEQLPRDYLERFKREVALYPDNFAAYRNKWFVAGAYDRESQHAMIEHDLRRLQRTVKGESVEGLYALASGETLLGHEEQARVLLRKMVALHPGAPLTDLALGAYEYQAYADRVSGEGPAEMRALHRRIAVDFPESQAARDRLMTLAADVETPLDAVERIGLPWIAAEPDNPFPSFLLAIGYEKREARLDDAAALAGGAADGMIRGRLRLYGDIDGSLTRFYLPEACRLAGRLALKQGRAAQAIGWAKTAQAVATETDPESWLLEASAWEAIGDIGATETARVEALRRGSKEADEALRGAWQEAHGSLEGFDDHLSALLGRHGSGAAARKPAPAFSVTAMDGTIFDSAALKGKVVVLNFWGIGCAPCKVEIPSLNRLVGRYPAEKVVFLALSGDRAADVRRFLEEHPFDYHVIPEAGRVYASYAVSSLPVHMIIGRDGGILAQVTGGGENSDERLALLIDRAIAE